MIRNDNNIRGIEVPGSGGQQIKLFAYMDDITVLIRDAWSVKQIIEHTESFCRASGSNLNLKKCECRIWGKWKEEPKEKIRLTDKVKVLGITFGDVNTEKEEWKGMLNQINQKIGFWSLRHLTMEGKILLVKAIILPKLSYLATVFYPPKKILKRILRTCFVFLWNSKCEKLARKQVMKTKENGGKGFPNIEKELELKHTATVVNLAINKRGKFADMLRYLLGTELRKAKLLKITNNRPMAFNVPKHYKIIKKCLQRYELEGGDSKMWGKKRELKKYIEKKETMRKIQALTEEQIRKVWQQTSNKELTNRQKDLG
ncbi:uncharacterized protein LOC127527764 [Erpetoichthys calabaricus]|uniref:uncharacterized protein LOC127527764 n=1 Tax=Erpetoichthys calabaricus TaxID=27687 RepID=UPI002234AE5A|nr:uncharacterized protein LOC127527764 [Erpetoichthys calabaricus]